MFDRTIDGLHDDAPGVLTGTPDTEPAATDPAATPMCKAGRQSDARLGTTSSGDATTGSEDPATAAGSVWLPPQRGATRDRRQGLFGPVTPHDAWRTASR